MNLQPSYRIDHLGDIQSQLQKSAWLVCCLCAAWCDTCRAYRPAFEQLAQTYSDRCFAWIDIEDHADLITDLDIENFPTILIQHNDQVLFLGTSLPDVRIVERLVQSYASKLAQAESITPSLQEGAQLLPAHWSLRRLILESNRED